MYNQPMEKWVIGAISIIAIIGVVFLVASQNNEESLFDNQEEEDSNLYNVGEDTDIPDGQEADINEQVGQIDLENNMQQNNQSKTLSKPELTIDTNKTYHVTLKTTEGDIVIELDAKNTPITANNFVYLAENNFYDNTIFHRVIEGFMIQGGDPTGTGTGSPGYRFDDEPVNGEYTRGTVAMANSGPDTNGSQFFIMHADYPLPKNYVIFGRVSEGMDVVDKIATAEVEAAGFSEEKSSPVNPVTVQDATVTVE